MRRVIFVATFIALAFSLGVVADETIKPTGWDWQKIGDARQLGYVEGFNAGISDSLYESFCGPQRHASQASEDCILYKLQRQTLVDTSTSGTLNAITKFYAQPQNLPVRWDHAVIVSKAMVSGVPINEKDLEVIRRDDAKSNVQ